MFWQKVGSLVQLSPYDVTENYSIVNCSLSRCRECHRLWSETGWRENPEGGKGGGVCSGCVGDSVRLLVGQHCSWCGLQATWLL